MAGRPTVDFCDIVEDWIPVPADTVNTIEHRVIARRGKAPTWQSPGRILVTACSSGRLYREIPTARMGLGMTPFSGMRVRLRGWYEHRKSPFGKAERGNYVRNY